MNGWIILMIVLAVGAFIGDFIMNAKGRQYANQLADYMIRGEFDKFDAMCEQKSVQICVAPFNIDYLKLNSYLMREDTKKVVEMYDDFRTKRLNKAQKKEVLTSGFNYFASSGDAERTEYYWNEINKLNGEPDLKENVNRLYDILFLKKTDMLEDILEETEEMPEHMRGSNEYLIAQIYTNMGDDKNAEKYSKLAEKHMEQMAKKAANRFKENDSSH